MQFVLKNIIFQGNLTGYIDQTNRVVEVTHCFEMISEDAEDDPEDNTRYYMDYMKYIREKGNCSFIVQ